MDTGGNEIHETLRAMVAEAAGLPLAAIRVSLRPPLAHQSNRLHDVWAGDRHFIAKEFLKPDEFHDAPIREFRALELLAPLDVAPQPLCSRPPTAPLGPLVVYEFMEGHMWDRHHPTAAELSQLAEVWLKIHALTADDLWMSRGYEEPLHQIAANFHARFEAYTAWAGAHFPPGRGAADLCLRLLDDCRAVVHKLSDHAPPLYFSWSDARFANVIRRPDGQLGLVDWEDSGLRDPARDLACLITHPNQEDLLSPDEWQAFLRPYLGLRSKLDPGLTRRVHLYLALYPIFFLSVLITHGLNLVRAGQLAGWTVNGLPPNERLRRYLARGLAWPDMDFSDQLSMLGEMAFFPSNL